MRTRRGKARNGWPFGGLVLGTAARRRTGRSSLLNIREARFRPQLPEGVFVSTTNTSGPVYLLVVTGFDVPAALAEGALRARRDGAALLVGLARPRLGFTTDAALVLHVLGRWQQEALQLARLGHLVLDGTGVTFKTVLMTCRGGGSLSEQNPRTYTAIMRLVLNQGRRIPYPSRRFHRQAP